MMQNMFQRFVSRRTILTSIGAAFIFLGAANGGAARAEELVIGFSLDTPPYVMDKASSGIEIEIVRAALAKTGHSFTTQQMPYTKLATAVNKNEVDAAATVVEHGDGTYYSENYIRFENYAFTKKDAGIAIDRISDLKGKSVVAWENAYEDLGPEFAKLFAPTVDAPHRSKYREIADQTQQVEMFYRGEADVIVIDKTILRWLSKQLADKVDTSAELVAHDIFADKTEFRISFKNEQIRDDFNRGLKQIRESGMVEKIYDKYLGD